MPANKAFATRFEDARVYGSQGTGGNNGDGAFGTVYYVVLTHSNELGSDPNAQSNRQANFNFGWTDNFHTLHGKAADAIRAAEADSDLVVIFTDSPGSY